jgi:hypothetical protein
MASGEKVGGVAGDLLFGGIVGATIGGMMGSRFDGSATETAKTQVEVSCIEEGYLLLTFASVACAEAFRQANKARVLELDAAQRLFRPKRLPRGRPIGQRTPPAP